MCDCHLKHTSNMGVATCEHMPRLIPKGSLKSDFHLCL